MPMSDEGAPRRCSNTSNLPSTIERQCLAQAPWVGMYRPLGIRIWSDVDGERQGDRVEDRGDYLRDTLTIWMDGRPEPSPNALSTAAGFSTASGKRHAHRADHAREDRVDSPRQRIPASDQSSYTVHITRHDNLLTVVTIQKIRFT